MKTLSHTSPPVLGARYSWREGCRPLAASNEKRDGAIARLMAKRCSGEYRELDLPCPCGHTPRADELLATRDRYAIPVDTVICRHCGIVRINPIMDDAAYARYYDEEYLDLKTQEHYASDAERVVALHASERLYARRIFDFVAGSKHKLGRFEGGGLKLADVGCGSGGMVAYFQERGWVGTGCDYDSRSLDYGRQRGLNLRLGDPSSLLGQGPFDLVILSHVFEHLVAPCKMMDLLTQLMRPGSLLYLELPGILDVSMPRYRNDFLRYLRFQHTYNYSLSTLTNLVESRGFRLLRGTEWIFGAFEYQGIAPRPMEKRPTDYRQVMDYLRHIESRRPLGPVYSGYLRLRHGISRFLDVTRLKRPVRAMLGRRRAA